MNNNDLNNTLNAVFEKAQKSFHAFQQKIDDSFFEAVRLIVSSKKIIVSGMGKSGYIAKKISATLSSYGFTSIYLHPVEALHGDIGIVEQGDVAILLSKSGSTDELVKLIPYLKSRNVQTIAIIGNKNSFIAKNSDFSIDASVESEACPFNIAPTTSALLALAVGDALAVCAVAESGRTVNDFARNHPLGQIGRNLTLQVKDIMHCEEAMPFVLVGDSFKNSIVEITNKSLGCVCIVDKNMTLKGIITDGDVRRIFQNYDDFSQLCVDDVMTKNPISIHQNTYLGEAMDIMENRKSEISILPVVDEQNHCVGVVRIHDIVRTGL